MNQTGLVSITFRALSPDEIIALAGQAGLDGIEWGGDIHVPHGDARLADRVGQHTRDGGLEVLCYGSYYHAGHAKDGIDPDGPGFDEVLESAVALRAPVIRVWAGAQGSADAPEDHWQRVVDDSHAIADRAAAAGIRIAYECHINTLTDTVDGAVRLLEAVDHPNIDTLWQPRPQQDEDTNLANIATLRSRLGHVHVFAWGWDGGEYHRFPLADHEAVWRRYLAELNKETPPPLLLEFVANDSPDQFLADAATLKAIAG